jgi:hypothetical protein
MSKYFILLAFSLLILTGCTPSLYTPYQPFNVWTTGGYADNQLGQDTHSVTYYTNMVTPDTKRKKMLLYRCAEVTIERGYDYFEVMQEYSRSPSGGGGFKVNEYRIKIYKGQPKELLEGIYIAKKIIEQNRLIAGSEN